VVKAGKRTLIAIAQIIQTYNPPGFILKQDQGDFCFIVDPGPKQGWRPISAPVIRRDWYLDTIAPAKGLEALEYLLRTEERLKPVSGGTDNPVEFWRLLRDGRDAID